MSGFRDGVGVVGAVRTDAILALIRAAGALALDEIMERAHAAFEISPADTQRALRALLNRGLVTGVRA